MRAWHHQRGGCVCGRPADPDRHIDHRAAGGGLFLPLRLLGSYFHIAMNGAASAEKIFKLLAAEEPADGDRVPGENTTLKLEHVTFGYEKDRTILNDVSFTIPQGSFVSLVGESGCGKSTIAALLSGSRTGYTGSVTLGGVPVQELQQEQRLRTLTLVPHNAAIFKGTVESNLRMAKPDADEAQLWAALEQVNLADFCRSQNGLQTALHEGGSNLSGGQRQRLAMRGLCCMIRPSTSSTRLPPTWMPRARTTSCRPSTVWPEKRRLS